MSEPTTQSDASPKWVTVLLGLGGLIAAFTWGFAEGTLFFIVPDILLTLTALFSIKKALLQTSLAVCGALLAGLLLFTWANRDYAQAYETVMSVPFVDETMADVVREDLKTHGAVGLLRGPFSGIPYKLYAVEAASRVDLAPFLLATIPARFERLLSGILLFSAIGYWQRKRIITNPKLALIGHAIYWIVLYAIYWGAI